MFERRLKIILLIPVACGIVLVARLFQLQIVRGDEYERLAGESLVSPRQFLPPLRGRLLDQFGRVLVSDEPATDVTVHYGALNLDEATLQRLANNLKRQGGQWRGASASELEAEVKRRIAKMWVTVSEATGTSLRDLRTRRDRICDSVERLRRHIWEARRSQGFEQEIDELRLREETNFHPILRDITPEIRARIEVALADAPFMRIEPSVRRVWSEGAEPLCHVLGSLGQVTAERIRDDPRRGEDDEDSLLECYHAGDDAGVSGVEFLGEVMLRGRRGFERRDLDGQLMDRQQPIDGLDVQLTVDLDLQRDITALLAEAVEQHPPSTGAACVVLDVQTREILALVSVPTFDRARYVADYAFLRDDAARRPLLFRAVAEEYMPGSILKPVALLAGFKYGLVDERTQVFCDGSFIPGSSKWHCWTYWKQMAGHGYVAAEDAIKHSCNVYFYGLGQRTGAGRLTTFYDMFIRGAGLASDTGPGTGLIEARSGIIPTAAWIAENRPFARHRPADGRNYAIGQGEVQLTPLQVANMFATLAAGRYRAPTIIANDGRNRPSLEIPGPSAEAWRIARSGLHRCVSEVGGTAYKHARLDNLEICGKTGSAQCVSRVVATRFTFADSAGGTQSIIAPTVENARESLGLAGDTPVERSEAVDRWPPNRPGKDTPPTHAWFAGFAPFERPKIALAVIVEYGGGGGSTAGPVGRAIFQALLESPHGYLSSTAKRAPTSPEPDS